MEFFRLGNSGLKISAITFGTALTIGTENNDIDYARKLISTAWDLGIRSFDVSNNYGNGNAEILTGKALNIYPRHQYVLSTKGSWPIGESVYEKGLSRKHIIWALDDSLKRLAVDYVDIYYAHRYDKDVPMQEIVRTFNYLINIGKIRYWATSEWPLEALIECHKTCDELNLEKPIAEQFIYSYALIKAETNGVKTFCDKNSVGTIGFSPLCQGYLTGKYKNGVPTGSRIAKAKDLNYYKTTNFYQQNKTRIDYFLSIAEKYSLKESDLALKWCLRKGILPVLGASRPEQLIENLSNLNSSISDNVWSDLEALF